MEYFINYNNSSLGTTDDESIASWFLENGYTKVDQMEYSTYYESLMTK